MTTVKKLILKKYKTVTEFADVSGWSQQRASYIANKDSKELTPLTIKKIATALNIEADELRKEIINQ